MDFYIKALRNGNPYYACYTGMPLGVVSSMITNLGCTDITFISKEEYELLAKEI